MKVLSVSFGYHDSSAALVVDNGIQAALAEERVSRQKHDPHFPRHAIKQILKQTGLEINDIDHVVFHEDPFHKFSRVLTSSLSSYPFSFKEFSSSVKSWMGGKLWAFNTISRELGIDESRISYLNHHFSHAAQAFMGSGFAESAIMVVDAVGDWSSSALYLGRWQNGAPKIDSLLEVQFPHSLGLVYSTFTAFLGFVPNDSECSTMALAGFGEPVYLDKIKKMVPINDDGTYQIDSRYFNFSRFYSVPYTRHFTKELGAPRDAGSSLNLDCLRDSADLSTEEKRYCDIAASVQIFLQEALVKLSERLYLETRSKNLCYAGGVALNCVANTQLLRQSPFEAVYIPPDPGDGGTSIGTALYYSAVETKCSQPMRYSVDCGTEYKEDLKFLDGLNSAPFSRYMIDQAIAERGNWKVEILDPKLCLSKIAVDLSQKKIVGWFQGRCEVGPRALGFRSILIRPDECDLARKLSRSVKKRATYRPYAVSMTRAAAEKILDLEHTRAEHFKWMQYSCEVKKNARHLVRAAMHIDGSTRPQVCGPEESSVFYELLVQVGKLTGCETLLNTSFNLSGYPIVEKPIDAILMFARTNMDVLVIGNTVLRKE